ncbi:MAG: 2OG-Fe(II) oxygenase [Alphaproteobacteria bacterium]|nr:2OG-Fe(II) oxygenase [Alphaproteobacteria bacterium]MCW5741388.1 2OG-Fe(II) oxygenase [Alphaproteobacteria bacterium]
MTSAFFPFRPGDRFPEVALPGVDGMGHKLSWSVQGEPLVVVALGDVRLLTAGPMGGLIASIADAGASTAVIVGANITAAQGALKGFAMPGGGSVPPVLCDPDRRVLATLLAPDPAQGASVGAPHDHRLIVLDANQRLVDAFTGADVEALRDAVLAAIAAARADRPPETVLFGSAAPVMMLPRVFEPAFCRSLIEQWTSGERSDGGVSSRYGNVMAADRKRTEDHIVRDPAMVKQITDRLAYRVGPELMRLFSWEAEFAFDAPVILSYAAGQQHFFRAHRDNGTPQTADRTFAVSLNLNEDYEGGELVFPEFGPTRYKPKAGMAAIFSCSLLHEALPVSEGRRFVLTTFFRDRKKQLQAQQQQRPPSLRR